MLSDRCLSCLSVSAQPRCVRWGPSSPQKWHSFSPIFAPCLLCQNGRHSQLLHAEHLYKRSPKNQNVMSLTCLFLYDRPTFIIVLPNNLYLFITHGNILSMDNKHKKLFVIQAVKRALIYTYNAPKCVWRLGSARTRWGS